MNTELQEKIKKLIESLTPTEKKELFNQLKNELFDVPCASCGTGTVNEHRPSDVL